MRNVDLRELALKKVKIITGKVIENLEHLKLNKCTKIIQKKFQKLDIHFNSRNCNSCWI